MRRLALLFAVIAVPLTTLVSVHRVAQICAPVAAFDKKLLVLPNGIEVVDRTDDARHPTSRQLNCEHHTPARILSVGDSHGRDIVQSPLVRAGRPHNDKERDWTATLPGTGLTITHVYSGRPKSVSLKPKSRRSFNATPRTPPHILLSRGTWDLMKYSTPLRSYYGAVRGLVRSAASSTSSPAAAASNDTAASTSSMSLSAASVTFKLVHHFAPPSAELGFFAECTNATVVAAYRRVAACAVAAHNREAAASGGRMQRASVLDAWDATAAMPRSAFADDGHHLVDGALHRVADAYLSRVVCPALLPPRADLNHASNDDRQRRASVAATSTNSSSSTSADGDPPEVWMSSDEAAIAARFACERVEELVRDDAGPEALEQELGLGPRRGCRCMVEKERVNDRCAFGRLVAAARSGSRKYADPNSGASVLAMYTRALAAASKDDSAPAIAWRTQARALRQAVEASSASASKQPAAMALNTQGRVAVGEAVIEMCLRPEVAVPCLANLGISLSPDTTHTANHSAVPSDLCRCTKDLTSFPRTAWCTTLEQRAAQLRRDWERITRTDATRHGSVNRAPRARRPVALVNLLRVAGSSDLDSRVAAYLSLACTAEWRALSPTNDKGRQSLIAAAIDDFAAQSVRRDFRLSQHFAALIAIRDAFSVPAPA